jgi:hypothetical protein
MINNVVVTMGPTAADPADVVKLMLRHEDGSVNYLGAFGWRMAWRKFLVWAIRRHVRNLK